MSSGSAPLPTLDRATMPETRHSVATEYRLEQTYVGLFIGKGEQIKKIQDQSGARVVVDQSVRAHGYSMVKVMRGPGGAYANQLVLSRLDCCAIYDFQQLFIGKENE